MKKLFCLIRKVPLFLVLGSANLLGVSESWETLDKGSFDGSGDLLWFGDISAFEIDSATWPIGFDLNGSRSLRSSASTEAVTATVVTDISTEFDASQSFRWSVSVSGYSAEITPRKRIDLILISDTKDTSKLETPNDDINAYKLSLWDPTARTGTSHAGAELSDSLSLWKVTSNDSEWQLIGWYELPHPANVNQGWNLRVHRSAVGKWTVSYSNGSPGTPVGSPVVSVVDTSVLLESASLFSGFGIVTTAGDSHDFGFDSFAVISSPSRGEPTILGPDIRSGAAFHSRVPQKYH